MTFDALFGFTVFIIGLIVVTIILYRHTEPSAKFLSLFIFTFTVSAFFMFLFQSKYMLQMPYFLRVGPLINYLSAPALFFYIKYMFDEKRPFKWWDLLHLAPAAIYFIDYL